ncbi:MAG: Trm112 family protein [Planctomycetota bacterium]|nr:Trm112 family protein [Planctomycetota bacterium]
MTKFDEAQLKFLVCPRSGESLEYDEKEAQLVSCVTGHRYPIRDGIAILLPDPDSSQSESDRP